MCAIYGYISSRDVDVRIFQECLTHRGPDGSGVFRDEHSHLTLGHSRLSIIDLSAVADQPMRDENDRFVLVFNGEIYNYQEIRSELEAAGYRFKTHSDTEVLLHAYRHFGKDCMKRFRGMFAFALFDKAKGKLFMARDRFGVKPLFYSISGGQFVFASEVNPIVASGVVPKVVSAESLNDYFLYGAVQQPRTIYKDIFALMPASYMELDVKTLTYETGQYYSYIDEAKALRYGDLSYDEAVKVVREKLEEATRYHLVADVEVGAFLSGGVDSTAVVALMAKYAPKAIRTFSVGFASKTEVEDETAIARESAAFLRSNHTDVIVDEGQVPGFFEGFTRSLDQPSVDGFNTYIVSEAAAKDVKVVLSGLGGDEIFGGYFHFEKFLRDAGKQPSIVNKLQQYVHGIRPTRFTADVAHYGKHPYEATVALRTMLPYVTRQGLLHRPSKQKLLIPPGDLHVLQHVSRAELDHYLLNTLLRDSDVMSMAHALECRPVLLDHVLVETAFALPDEYKVRNGVKKSIFIDAVKDIIPAQVYQRKKSGFEMPLGGWMNNQLRSFAMDSLNSGIARELFTKAYLAEQTKAAATGELKRSFWQTLILLRWFNHTNASLL